MAARINDRQIEAFPCNQANAASIAVSDDAEAIVLDFVDPARSCGWLLGQTWQTGLKSAL